VLTTVQTALIRRTLHRCTGSKLFVCVVCQVYVYLWPLRASHITATRTIYIFMCVCVCVLIVLTL